MEGAYRADPDIKDLVLWRAEERHSLLPYNDSWNPDDDIGAPPPLIAVLIELPFRSALTVMEAIEPGASIDDLALPVPRDSAGVPSAAIWDCLKV